MAITIAGICLPSRTVTTVAVFFLKISSQFDSEKRGEEDKTIIGLTLSSNDAVI